MPLKDFILQEIEKIGTLLKYLINKLAPSISIENVEETIELINQELVENSGFNIEKILSLSINDFDEVLTKNKGYNYENIELLADLLFTIGNNPVNTKYLQKALVLYNYIDKKSKTYSFERADKINNLKALL